MSHAMILDTTGHGAYLRAMACLTMHRDKRARSQAIPRLARWRAVA